MTRAMEASSDLEQAQKSQLETNRGMATELELSLRSMRDGDVSALLKMLGDMGVRLVSYASETKRVVC